MNRYILLGMIICGISGMFIADPKFIIGIGLFMFGIDIIEIGQKDD